MWNAIKKGLYGQKILALVSLATFCGGMMGYSMMKVHARATYTQTVNYILYDYEDKEYWLNRSMTTKEEVAYGQEHTVSFELPEFYVFQYVKHDKTKIKSLDPITYTVYGKNSWNVYIKPIRQIQTTKYYLVDPYNADYTFRKRTDDVIYANGFYQTKLNTYTPRVYNYYWEVWFDGVNRESHSDFFYYVDSSHLISVYWYKISRSVAMFHPNGVRGWMNGRDVPKEGLALPEPAFRQEGEKKEFLYWRLDYKGKQINYNAGELFKPLQDELYVYHFDAVWAPDQKEVEVDESTYKIGEKQKRGRIRFISRDYLNTLKSDSKWRSGEYKEVLNNALS